ncbi:MAG: transcriptional repressor [Paludibacteraceae bacterium]|nr:transcriptional repressor [Paludibacteraceae bacterium]MBQ9426615.1 transcriptional repressor [Paludibacteraceae bacterium]
MAADKTYNLAIDRLVAYIRSNGLRPSAVRKMILKQICDLPQPFPAKLLVEACVAERISIGSVYNALNLFIKANILRATTRQRGNAATEYELVLGSPVRMMLVCQRCGRRTEFHDKAIDRLVRERKYSNFNLQQYSLVVYGECKVCRKKKKSDK